MAEERKRAVVFPGQGAQRPGMAKDFSDEIPVCRQTFEEASDTLQWDVAALCFGEDERLNLTEYTQPCLLTTEIAMLRGLREKFDFSPAYFGGHSLGEFTALVASGAFPFPEALRIVQTRGRLMQKAVPVGIGAMAAIISEDLDAELLRRAVDGLPIDLANLNSPHQVVISGEAEAMPAAETRIRDAVGSGKALRFVPLNVSAPFHSRFMEAIEAPFTRALNDIEDLLNPGNAVHVTSNYAGGFHGDRTDEIIRCLVRQLSNPVRWMDNMRCLAGRAGAIYELGPGRPLRDFFKASGVACVAITTFSAAERHFRGND